MENADPTRLIIYVIAGMTVMLSLVLTVIVFAVLAKRKAAQQRLEIEKIKSKHQKELFNSVISAQESERQRIAHNLHDDVGTTLSATSILVSNIQNKAGDNTRTLLSKSKEMIDNAIQEIRLVINDLSPVSLYNFGLNSEILKIVRILDSTTNTKLTFNTNIDEKRYSENIELNLYRILKEFINNTMKYAEATEIRLDLYDEQNKIRLEISDNGKGFDKKKISRTGHGLNNMESRVYLMNGQCNLTSELGHGTKLSIEIPLIIT